MLLGVPQAVCQCEPALRYACDRMLCSLHNLGNLGMVLQCRRAVDDQLPMLGSGARPEDGVSSRTVTRLSVCVVDLHRLAIGSRQDIAGPRGSAVDHVFACRYDEVNLQHATLSIGSTRLAPMSREACFRDSNTRCPCRCL
jgi:hypothetical protein